MDTVASAAFSSWSFDAQVIVPILLAAGLYLRGWLRLRRVLPSEFSDSQLASFLSGLALVFIAIESPLDTFSSLLLGVHMVQHLLLMMIAPPLILYGQPMLPCFAACRANSCATLWARFSAGVFYGAWAQR